VRTTTVLDYDDYGNETVRTQAGLNATSQSYRTEYDTRGLVPIKRFNAVHENMAHPLPPTRLGIDLRSGETRWIILPDGSWSASAVDCFGNLRKKGESATGANITEISYERSGLLGGAQTVTTSAPGQPTVSVESNAFGNVIATRTTEWNPAVNASQTRIEEVGYDARGRAVSRGVSHLVGTPSPASKGHFLDHLGRVILERIPHETPDGTLGYTDTRHAYWTRATTPTGDADYVNWAALPGAMFAHSKEVLADDGGSGTTVTDVRGNVLASIDASGTVTTFVYGPFDYLKSVSLLGNSVTFEKDELGNTTKVTDPDTGVHSYTYDGLGLLHTETYGGHTTTYTYDGLGRKDLVTTTDGTIYDFEYDGDGTPEQLSLAGRVETESVTSSTTGNSTTTYEYKNSGGRISAIHRLIDGETFPPTVVTNDDLGRIQVIEYPSPTDRPLAVRYSYEPNNGRLAEVSLDGEENSTLWKLEGIDQFGNATQAAHGQALKSSRTFEPVTGKLDTYKVTRGTADFLEVGLVYDARGLLERRTTSTDGVASVEQFGHDTHSRIVSRIVDGGTEEVYAYDLKGNLTRTPLTGTLYYDGPKPHQVMHTDDGRVFRYDDGRNQTSRTGAALPGGSDQTLTYTEFDLPRLVVKGSGTTVETTTLHYDARKQRVSQATTIGDAEEPARESVYLGTLYRRDIERDDDTEAATHTARVPTPDGMTIEIELLEGVNEDGIPNRAIKFLQVDHLGSVLSTADADGNRLASATYSPFGIASASTDTWGRFSGKETDDSWGLVNMGGRLYDPAIGRFVSPDPFVASAQNSQSWNPYSYVENTPLNALDPSGFQGMSVWGEDDRNYSSADDGDGYSGSYGYTSDPLSATELMCVTVSGYSERDDASPLSKPGKQRTGKGRLGLSQTEVTIDEQFDSLATVEEQSKYLNWIHERDHYYFQLSLNDGDPFKPLSPEAVRASRDAWRIALYSPIGYLKVQAYNIVTDPQKLFLTAIQIAALRGGRQVNAAPKVEVRAPEPIPVKVEPPVIAPNPAPVAQVTVNKQVGDGARDALAAALEAEGRIVETEVFKRTPFGPRYIDIEVSQPGAPKPSGGIEVKTGNSPYTPSQRAKDTWLKYWEGYTVDVVRLP